MQDFEKLGVFYLGRLHDLKSKRSSEDLLLYDSKDLVTHAVCVGMTGSGKTGLCIGILEEAAIDGIPAIVIDPKGDLANLLLTFPDLRPEDFAPWINEDDARKKGLSPQDYAAQQAEMWRKGLASWGQDGERIRRLRSAADFAIYTPGSNAGIPVSILKSFAAPAQAIRDDVELFRERISTTATSLLGLMGIDADPLQSREHILISTILATAWKDGRDLDLATLIQQIQSPPITRIGVLDLESFFAAKDRFALSMRLNNLLAAPGFENWLQGQALDIGSILYGTSGKPRVAIFSIAHLSDAERMFFVSLLLNEILGWMRSQSGTTSLRALVYMDEIFGYFPPVANPPSKAPLLTLLKQARAFGVGVMLATQNPVDLDYKGLSNTGTWFIGRLQTERDKARVLEGLEGAAASSSQRFDRGKMEEILAGLGNRIFLMNNVHEDAPVVFETRWAMSYLRGPLTRAQIRQLSAVQSASTTTVGATPASRSLRSSEVFFDASTRQTATQASPLQAGAQPMLPPGVTQRFIPIRSGQPQGATLVYQPRVIGCATVYFNDPKSGVDTKQPICSLASVDESTQNADWNAANPLDCSESDLESSPAEGASFAPTSSALSNPKSYDTFKRTLADALFRVQKLELFRSPTLKALSQPGESDRDFRIRLQQFAREERDALAEKLRLKYAPKMQTLQDRIRRAEQAVDREQSQARQSKFQAAISFGTTILGAFLGRKKLSAGTIGRATTTARGVGRASKESQDVDRAEENVGALKQQLADLETQFKTETDELTTRIDPATEELETVAVRPKKTDITVGTVALAWAPYWQSSQGRATPAWE